MLRRRLLRIGGFLLWTAIIAVVGNLGFQIYRARYCEQLLSRIDMLVLSPPPDVSELGWASIIFWTHNLHCNTVPQVYASLPMLHTLDNLINDAAKQPDKQKINRLWEEYSKMSRSGFTYRQEYSAVRDEIAETISIQGNNYADFRSYNDFLVSIRARHQNKQ